MSEFNKNVISNAENKIKLNSGSISGLNISSPITRKDIFGNTISKKTKKHKICFADQAENNSRIFVDIVNVNSYRKYNQDEPEEGKTSFYLIVESRCLFF